MNLSIDFEFQAIIPTLTCAEHAQFDPNVWAEGCRDPPS
jgi:hypothetical protein